MYIRGLIPRNFAELAEAVPIATKWRFAGGPTVAHFYMLTVLLLTAYP